MPLAAPSLSLRERKKLDTFRALASTAVRLVAERGLEHVTVEDISAEAGVSARTFFNYFASKEDAVVIAYPDYAEHAEQAAELLLAAPPGMSTLEALAAALATHADRIQADREEWLHRIAVIEANPSLISRLVAIGGQAERSLLAAIGRRTGLDPDEDLYPVLLHSAVCGVFNAAVRRWYRLNGEQSLNDLLRAAVAALAAGLPDPGKS
jgi:AcrR family transcriptional regulator